MIPKSLSATAAQAYVECPKRYEVEYLDKTPSAGGEAAHLGTCCHSTFEEWVRDGHYLKNYLIEWEAMRPIWDKHYSSLFPDHSRYEEGAELCRKWLERQDWTGRKVLSVESKRNFILKTSAGEIPFNFIFDREDALPDGEFEIVDYKSLQRRVTPAQLRNKLQARAYGLAGQLLHPDAPRIWVTFDMLRHGGTVGVAFTKEDNRETWRYIHRLVEWIIADQDPKEKLGDGCRYCVRKSECTALTKHAAAGGPLGITDLVKAAERRYELQSAKAGIEAHLTELDALLLAELEDKSVEELELGDYEVGAKVSGRRSADPRRVAAIVGGELMGEFGKVGVKEIEMMLKDDRLTADQKVRLRGSLQMNFGDPSIVVNLKSVL